MTKRESQRAGRRAGATLLAVALGCLCSAAVVAQVRELPSPAGPASGQPNLATGPDGRAYLSWIERLPGETLSLRFAVKEGARWSAPRVVGAGRNWFANWADFPSLIVLPDGSLAAHWLVNSGAGAYAFDVHIARSFDGGQTWSKSYVPHRDGTPTEHGFVSMFPTQSGGLAAVWLDGRATKASADGHGHGNMALRYAALRRDGRPEPEVLLDGRVCECCQTSAALTADGPVVAYRDRSEREMRDIAVVRLRGGRWTQPTLVHADNWQLDGCPINGPAVAAAGKQVGVAWFTAANDAPHVHVAFSSDAGATFAKPVPVDDGRPLGRVDILMLDDGSAVVSWLERTDTGGAVRVRRVWPDGKRGDSVTVAAAGIARANGFPQMTRAGDALVFAWVGTEKVLTAEMPLP